MATLHMDVESARTVQSKLVSTQGQLTTDVSTMTSSVQGMVGSSWMGNSATEFLNEYENWRGTMSQMLEALTTLSTRLQNEIAEWEAMASKLS